MKSGRRRFFQAVGTGAAGLTLGRSASAFGAGDPVSSPKDDGPVLQVGEDIAVADTQYGKVLSLIHI